MDEIKIITRFKSQKLTAREYISYCKELIRNIKNVFPEMHLHILDDKDKVHFFREDLSDFGEENLHKIIMEDKEIVYYNPDKDNKRLTIDSTCWTPFGSLFFLHNCKETDIYKDVDISISVSQGANDINNKMAVIIIEFSDQFKKKLNEDILKSIVVSLERSNDLKYATIISHKFRRNVKEEKQKFWIGYLTYFANKEIPKLLENVGNIDISETNLGAMISLESLEFSEENIQKAIQIRDILAEKGLLSE